MGTRIKRHLIASMVFFAVVACGPAAEQVPTPEPEDNAGSLAPESKQRQARGDKENHLKQSAQQLARNYLKAVDRRGHQNP